MYFYFLDIYETSPVSFVQSKKKEAFYTSNDMGYAGYILFKKRN